MAHLTTFPNAHALTCNAPSGWLYDRQSTGSRGTTDTYMILIGWMVPMQTVFISGLDRHT